VGELPKQACCLCISSSARKQQLQMSPKIVTQKLKIYWTEFNVHGPVHRKNILIYISNKMQRYTVYFIWKLLYIFRVAPPPILRSANNCIYSIWYLSHRYCYRGRVGPHRSGCNFQRATLAVLCVMFQVRLSFVVNLSNVFLV
jgi:hypothetical protein